MANNIGNRDCVLFSCCYHWLFVLIYLIVFLHWNTNCEITKQRRQLLFANRRDIRAIDLQHNFPPRHKYNTTVLINDLEDATALDWYGDNICWSDIQAERLQCAQIQSAGGSSKKSASEQTLVISTNLPAPEDLSCDWLSLKLYWTDSETNRIEVVSLVKPYHRAVLVHEDIDQPRAIVVSPKSGLMFWSDWGEIAKIERAGMDGAGRRILVAESELVWPNGLALDEENHIIYWIDGKLHSVGYISYDGAGRGTLPQSTSFHPFALVYSNGMLYWSDWHTNSLHFMPSDGTSSHRTLNLVRQALRPMDIVFKATPVPELRSPCLSNPCSHLCLLNAQKSYTCACPTGLRKLNSTTCATEMDSFLLVARSTEIRMISLDTTDYTDIDLNFKNLKHVLAIDYYNGTVYWTDDELRRIESADIKTGTRKTVASIEIVHPDGIVIDYNSEQIYWTDAGTDRIETSKLDGSARKVLVARGLQEPRAIAVDGQNGLLFWSDWGRRPKIERSNLDGTARAVIIQTDIEWPNGIALDHANRQLYWCDASTDRIEVALYDGSRRRVLLSENLPHTFGFTIVGDYLYWTDWQRRIIERASKIDGSDRKTIKDPFPDPMGVRGIEKKNWKLNACWKGGKCEQLCFWVEGVAKCACGEGYELNADNTTCSSPKAYIVFTKSGDLHKLSLQTHTDELIPVGKVKQALAIGLDHKEGFVYWSDAKMKSISRGRVRSGWDSEKIIDIGLRHPEGIAVDYISRNIYWTDVGLNRIEVATLNGTNRRVILWEVEAPKSITIDFSKMLLYFSTWGNEPAIETCQLDGSSRQVFLKTNGRVNGLCLDSGFVYYANIDSGSVERAHPLGFVEHVAQSQSPFSLTIFQDTVFFSDLASNRVLSTPKVPTPNATKTIAQSIEVLDMNIYNQEEIPTSINHCDTASCSHLCFNSLNGAKCACPTHYKYINNTCIEPEEFLLVATSTSVVRLLFDTNDCPDVILQGGMKKVRRRGIAWTTDGGLVYSDGKWGKDIVSGESDFSIGSAGLVFWSGPEGGLNITSSTNRWIGGIWSPNSTMMRGAVDSRPSNIFATSRYVFFSMGSVIYRIRYDGLNLTTLHLSAPVQDITVDHEDKVIYFVEGGTISSSDLDFGNRRSLANIEGVGKLVANGRYLYYVHGNGTLERMNKHTGNDRKRLAAFEEVLDLIAVTPKQFPQDPSCNRCSHICVEETNQCACPVDLQLAQDMKTCIFKTPCGPSEFTCSSGSVNCVLNIFKCNGVPDCFDGSDEFNCCKPCPELQCTKGSQGRCPPCYSFTQQCDRVIDCPVDGVDENETNCPSGPDIVYYFVPIIAVLLVIGCLVFALCKWNRTRKRTKTPLRTLNTAETLLFHNTTSSTLPQLEQMTSSRYNGSSSSSGAPCDLLVPNPSPATDSRFEGYYKTGPPPTPCSTDVCDESEIYAPPPPSPHTSNSTSSMKYFFIGKSMPGPPPPSPVL